MDASLLLERQGWKKGTGLGFSGHGISKPVLVSQKQNSLGLGATTKTTQWDQWWSKALDSSLNSLQVENRKVENREARKPEEPASKEATAQATVKRGLYAGFTKGSGLEGTKIKKSKPLKIGLDHDKVSKENVTERPPKGSPGPDVKRRRKKSAKQTGADEGGRVNHHAISKKTKTLSKAEKHKKRTKHHSK